MEFQPKHTILLMCIKINLKRRLYFEKITRQLHVKDRTFFLNFSTQKVLDRFRKTFF